MGRYRYEVGCVTDKGNIRPMNQDSILAKKGRIGGKEFVLAVVADGMGGMDQGEMASSEITRGLNEWWNQSLPRLFWQLPSKEIIKLVDDSLSVAIESCNSRILKMAEKDGIKTGSTLSMVFLYDGFFIMKQVGDSRIYLYEHKVLRQISKDQTWCQKEVDEGKLSPDQVRGHKMEHVLVNAIGHDYQLQIEGMEGPLNSSAQIILCSDGAYHFLKESQMQSILKDRKNCQRKAEEASEMIKQTKADDNFSIIIVRQEKRWWPG